MNNNATDSGDLIIVTSSVAPGSQPAEYIVSGSEADAEKLAQEWAELRFNVSDADSCAIVYDTTGRTLAEVWVGPKR